MLQYSACCATSLVQFPGVLFWISIGSKTDGPQRTPSSTKCDGNAKGGGGSAVGKVFANNANVDAVIKGDATVTVTGGTIEAIKVNEFYGDNCVKGTTKLICEDSYAAIATGFATVEKPAAYKSDK